jgi:hypothetical protein
MSRSTRFAAAVWLLASAVATAGAFAQPPIQSGAKPVRAVATASARPLSPRQRGDLTRQFVLKWGGYAQRIYNVPVQVWAKRMVPNFAVADPTNFRKALQRETFEGALAELAGTGHRLADTKVIDLYAREARGSSAQAVARKLGDTTGDLVFTAVTPCRILDTRVAGGPIAANSSRAFLGLAVNSGANFSSQGGSATNCNVAAVGASAIVLNVTAVTPSGAGFATVYKSGESRPLAASVNYTAGAIVNNSVVVGVPNPLAITDFVIYTFAQSDYVVDIVGYFSPPQATALQCENTAFTQSVSAGSNFDIVIPACPAGYTITGAGCATGGFNQADWAVTGLDRGSPTQMFAFCSGTNKTAGNISVRGTAQCCRIPGR